MATMKKDSAFSVEAGLKYLGLGAFSSSLFLFGSSILYGVSGAIYRNFKKPIIFYKQVSTLSFTLPYAMDEIPDPELTFKIIIDYLLLIFYY